MNPYSEPATEIHLRQALQDPDTTIWEMAQGLPGLNEGTDTIRFFSHTRLNVVCIVENRIILGHNHRVDDIEIT